MAISDADSKLLWGRAAGICSNPTCRQDLTKILEGGEGYNVGEMAHIIAKKPTGPRANGEAGPDTYSNTVLLCPTCHRRIDKAPPGEYPEEMLHEWKAQHEAAIRQLGSSFRFRILPELKDAVARLLRENHHVWKEFGPKSEIAEKDPGSNAYVLWNFRKLDTIIPNNSRIVNMIESNIELLTVAEHAEFLKFKSHAIAFERHQYGRLDAYPLFPTSFGEAFAP
jgi:hypothetical protein